MLISQDIQKYCSAKGLRRNVAREVVADMLQKVEDGATIEAVWLMLNREGYKLSESSVYQHVRWLTENGFARKSSEKGGKAEFHISRYK